MPHYDYKCTQCGFVHEETRPVEEIDDQSSCPACNNACKYHFNPTHINVHVVGGPTHKWDSSCPFLPKRYDSEGRPVPFETPGAFEAYKKDHDLIDAFDIEADSPIQRYDGETLAMEEHRKRVSREDDMLVEYERMDPKKKVFGETKIANVDDDGDIQEVSSFEAA